MFYFDELNTFLYSLKAREFKTDSGIPYLGDLNTEVPQSVIEDLIDEIHEFFVLGYLEGRDKASNDLNKEAPSNLGLMERIINKEIAGKTYEDRVRDYLTGNMGETTGTPQEAIARVVETESTRIFNESVLESGRELGAKTKTWQTMEDDRVRLGHELLQGVTVPIDAYFYTEGDRALAPGGFESADLNINCRCTISVK